MDTERWSWFLNGGSLPTRWGRGGRGFTATVLINVNKEELWSEDSDSGKGGRRQLEGPRWAWQWLWHATPGAVCMTRPRDGAHAKKRGFVVKAR